MRLIAIILSSLILSVHSIKASDKPRVFIFTDINLAGGDPDDRQSLVHLFWYADVLDIEGIVPDSWNRQGIEACLQTIDRYEQDYKGHGWDALDFPAPVSLRTNVARDEQDAISRLRIAAFRTTQPLYVLVWGQMKTLRKALDLHPELIERIRVFSIGTGRKYGPKDEVPGEDCDVPNWNGKGRSGIYEDERFDDLWWIESNWTYNGMFVEPGPTEMFSKLAKYGQMGHQIQAVTADHPWAQYFRVGDTPSVLYVIDSKHDLDDPEASSWAGRYKRPFPVSRPNYYTDDCGALGWDYADPCKTWHLLEVMYAFNKSTLLEQREDMYQSLIKKLNSIYGK